MSKIDPLIHLLGEIDELNAHLGLIHSQAATAQADNILDIINDLFRLGANLAGAPGFNELDLASRTLILESLIDSMTEQMPPLTNFIYPAGSATIANVHICRAICRRVERNMISQDTKFHPSYLCYINRLSDFLFTFARYTGYTSNTQELIVHF